MQKTRNLGLVLHLTLLLSLFLTACSTQTTSGAGMAEANRLYEQGKFTEAAARYQALVDAGAQDGQLYYNLANAYFKTGDLGRAILNYRRAQRLLPRDGDVTTNLELARAQTLDHTEVKDKGAIVQLVRRLVDWSTLDEASVAALLLWIGLCGLVMGVILWGQRRRILLYLAGTVVVFLLFGMISIGIKVLDERGQPPAVVVVTEVEVRSGPGKDYLAEFTLHAGTQVRLIERRSGWLRITLPGDLQGWAPEEAITEL